MLRSPGCRMNCFELRQDDTHVACLRGLATDLHGPCQTTEPANRVTTYAWKRIDSVVPHEVCRYSFNDMITVAVV